MLMLMLMLAIGLELGIGIVNVMFGVAVESVTFFG